MNNDPTKRFTDRADKYVKYRPGYPGEVITFLQKHGGLSPASVIADIGSGTGIFTQLLLNRDYKVYAVEPNAAMREAAEQQLTSYRNFTSVNGTAEATTLKDNSISLVVCAQAFHWFDAEKTRVEFKRILIDNGYAALIWNNRDAQADDFSRAYEDILKQDSIDYNRVNHRNVNEINFRAFFKDGAYQCVKSPNVQVFDMDGLAGRAFSSSYVPAEGTGAGEKFRKRLTGVFEKYNTCGKVSFHYQTEVYLGKI